MAPPEVAASRAKELFARAHRAQLAGDLDAAIPLYNEVLAIAPAFPSALNDLGVALRKARRLDAAVACYRRVLERQPDNINTLSNLGNVLKDAGRHDEALVYFARALTLKPRDFGALYNCGITLKDSGRVDEAIAVFRKCLDIKPDDANVRWDLSLALLSRGDFAEGWHTYESRWDLSYMMDFPFPERRWNGRKLDGTILLATEQGFGDAIQFIRYVPLVKQRCRRVVLECSKGSEMLFASADGVDEVITRGHTLPDFDAYMPLLSLPSVFGTMLATIPAETPYLQVDAARRQRARDILAPLGDLFRVGIVWAGSPTHKNDHNRSLNFEHFMRLLDVPGLALLSLQKGERVEEMRDSGCGGLITNLEPVLSDFSDTAALVAELDLVIMCDSSVAHLAGAIGQPVWVLLPFAPDWRWLYGRDDSPWYPTMRLYRQNRMKQWDEVIDRVIADLRQVVGAKRKAA